MIDRLTPLSFSQLMRWIVLEQKKSGSIFGVRDFYQANPFKTLDIFNEKIEMPFGPASGPHTQYAQGIVASYATGCRFFELRTVSVADATGMDDNPKIRAKNEGYNVEGARNLTMKQSFEEYVKAWIALKVLSKEFEMGGMNGFVFNMGVGYNYESIASDEMTEYFNNMRNASDTPIFKECIQFLKDNIKLFQNFSLDDIDEISGKISTSVTVSTYPDCTGKEIEKISKYLLRNCGFNTYVKLSTTLLGYDYCRSTLDTMGYYDVEFGREHFDEDLQYSDAVAMINKLLAVSNEENLLFGIKLSSGFPVAGHDDKTEEIFMSGKALFPLSIALAAKLSDDFEGHLRIAFSGGVDANNVEDIYEAGVWPITMSTTILKPGGYNRFKQFAYTFHDWNFYDFYCTRTGMLKRMAEKVKSNNHFTKSMKPNTIIKSASKIPLTDCFIAPCKEGCPIHQDVTAYLNLIGEERYTEALRVIMNKNPLPFITGTMCSHECMGNCTRNYYEKPVKIREAKLIAAQNGYDDVIEELGPKEAAGRQLKIAIVGGGPAGMSSAFFLAEAGHKVTLFCHEPSLGGTVKYLVPDFRISPERVDKDASFLYKFGCEIKTNIHVDSLTELTDYDKIILAMGATTPKTISIKGMNVVSAVEFLTEYKKSKGKMEIGQNVCVIGCGDTAMDVARAAKRNKGVDKVYVIYQRTRRYMPADEEEMKIAFNEGVEFMELLTPFEYSDGFLKCYVNTLGDLDENGRRVPVVGNEIFAVKADYVIAAVGEAVDTGFYKNNGINVNEFGLPILNEDTLETNIPNVYVAGDAGRGTSHVVNAIADARKISDAILNEINDSVINTNNTSEYVRRQNGRRSSDNRLSGLYSKKGIIREPHYRNDGGRCLDCERICENCVDVCPNRANVEIKIPGDSVPQVIHVDRLCNECGNCKTFCPYTGAPYKEKFTLFDTLEDFNNSESEGCVFTHDGSAFTIRIDGKIKSVSRIEAAEFNGIDMKLCNLIAAIYQYYRYLIV